MPLLFLESTRADLGRISSFLLSVFEASPGAGFVEPALLEWKYFTPRPDWTGSRSRMLVNGDRIIGHGCVIPVSLRRRGGTVVTAMRVIDWAGDRKTPGAGIMVMKKFGDLADNILAIGGSAATVQILPRAGFRTQGECVVYARPVRPGLQRRTYGHPQSRRRAWGRWARNTVWSWKPLGPALPGWRAVPWKAADATHARAAAAIPETLLDSAAIPERTADQVNYLLACPAARFSAYVLETPTGPRGYFLLCHVLGQTRIADLRVDSPIAAEWTAAYRIACQQAAALPETCEVSAIAAPHFRRHALEANGFQIRGRQPVFISGSTTGLAESEILDLGLLEGDEAFLADPENPYLT